MLLSAASVFGACLLSIPSFAADDVYHLKVSHFLPVNHLFNKTLESWAEELKAKSNGQLQLQIYPLGQIGPAPEQFDLARTGVIDISLGLTGTEPGRFPLTEVANLPFVVANSETASKRLTELAPKYLKKEFPGVKILYLIATDPLKFHLTNRAITRIDDFKGLRIRYAGSETVRAFGATPVSAEPAEAGDAMAKGTIDGALLPYEGAQSFQLGDVAKYSLEPGINAATFFLAMNNNSYTSLPPKLRQLIDDTTGTAAAARLGHQFDLVEAQGRQYMLNKGVKISTASPALLDDMHRLTQPIIQSYLAKMDAAGLPASDFYTELTNASRP
ncbi:TRAP transporter substrate-binding protein [Marinobacterium sp. D7]|uniref:TRAP transporter substrate-binding protein n=1 Tax=Marinobacterium ramblicola TaxID=2849041 RepID=UPI001C2CD9F4|nr:TRAP transporter substrate-binding protein [Marinobacterium ramblicola]MBV1788705.1 TRAP transporter substrate-binding protein [Marinobacterium ramblicola]